MKNNKKIIIGIITLIIILLSLTMGFVRNYKKDEESKNNDLGIPIEMINVRLDSLTEGLNYIGTLESKLSVTLSTKIASQIVELNTEEGSMVQKGEVIAHLDNSQFIARLDTAIKKKETLLINYAYLVKEVENFHISNPMVKKIDTLQVNYEYLSKQDEDYKILYSNGAISESAYEQVKHELDMVTMQLEEAKAASLDSYNKLVNQRDTTFSQINELQANINELNLSIADTNIVAIGEGKVRTLYYQTGDLTAIGKPFAIIDNVKNLTVKVNVSEQDLKKISVGSRTKLKITGVEEEIEATVSKIMPSVNQNTRVGVIEIDVPAIENMDLTIGMSVEVRFITQEVQEEIIVPKSTIKSLKDKLFIYVIENDRVYEREIKTGLAVGDAIQITEGLKSGEKIATNNLAKLYDGAKVYIIKGDD